MNYLFNFLAQFRYLMVLAILGIFCLSSPLYAGQYEDIIEDARGKKKPATEEKKEEQPVQVQYSVGDTSSFFSDSNSPVSTSKSSEWDEWDEYYEEW